MFEFVYRFLDHLGYTHPIHPADVHIPIGLVIGALVLGLVARLWRLPTLARCARTCAIVAFIFLFPTILFGYMDWQHFYGGVWLFPLKIKVPMAALLVVLVFVSLVLGRRHGPESKGVIVSYALCFCAVVVLGYFGANLVYAVKVPPGPKEVKAGENIYRARCSACHPHGGNIIKPNLPVRGAPELADFQKFSEWLRHPDPPMPAFPAKTISDRQAKELYDYVMRVLERPRAKKAAQGG
jgi:uncharacterized membrane protein